MKFSWIFLLFVGLMVVWVKASTAKSSSSIVKEVQTKKVDQNPFEDDKQKNGKNGKVETSSTTTTTTTSKTVSSTTTTTKSPSDDYDDDSSNEDDSEEDDKNKGNKKEKNSLKNRSSSSTTSTSTTQRSTSTGSTELTSKPNSSPTTKAPSDEADAIDEVNVDPQSSDLSLNEFEKDAKKEIKDMKNKALRDIAKQLKIAREDQNQGRITKSQYLAQKRQLKKAKKRVIKRAKSKQRELEENVKALEKQS